MITAIIIDDEEHCIQSLKTDLSVCCAQVQVMVECRSGKEGLLAIRKLNPQLVFLDIQMPWMNGFEMLEVIEEIHFAIIFTTAYDQFAARAFRISAVDYLVKPIAAEDLKAAVKKAEQYMFTGNGNRQVENLLHNMREPAVQQRIALPQRDGYEFMLISDIMYLKAEGAYTEVYRNDARKFVVSKTLGDVAELLPETVFLRIHHATIININFIKNVIRSDGGYVVLKNGEKLSISKSRKEGLMERLGLK